MDEKLKQIEARLDAMQPKKKDGWDKFQALSTFISGLIVLLAGLFITNRIENALKERQLQAQNARDMQEILAKLDAKASPQDALNASLSLAVFGRYAVLPLIQVIQNHGPEHQSAAVEGLRAAGAVDLKAVCQELIYVLQNPTRMYSFEVHLNAAMVTGDLNCREAVPVLRSYTQRLASAKPGNAPFIKATGAQDLLDADITSVKTTAERSLQALEGQQ